MTRKAPEVRPESASDKDVVHPDIDPARHSPTGAQELPTLPAAAGAVQPAPASGASAIVDPQPSIGVTHDEGEDEHKLAQDDVEDQGSINSYEQALSLEEVPFGKAKVWVPPKGKKAKGGGVSPKNDTENPQAGPVQAFKDKNRRTLVVAKQGGRFVSMPAYKEAA
jgi:hypothetical protein